jgi:uncharacterized protein
MCQFLHLMILSYSAENFYSLREQVTVDFTIGAQAHGRAGVFRSESEQYVNSVIGVFGANASGKTNLLKALGFLSWFILDSARSKPGAKVLYEPFEFTADTGKPTKLQMEFEFKGSLYRYELELAEQKVVREALFRKKTRFSYLFERELDGETGEYAFKAQDLGAVASVPQRENASWLSSALLQAQPFAVELRPFFESIHGNLGPDGRLPTHDAEITNVFEAAGYYLSAPETLEHVSNLLSEFDLGLSGVSVQKHKVMGPDGKEQEAALCRNPGGLRHSSSCFVTFFRCWRMVGLRSSMSSSRGCILTWFAGSSSCSSIHRQIRNRHSSSRRSTRTSCCGILYTSTRFTSRRRVQTS